MQLILSPTEWRSFGESAKLLHMWRKTFLLIGIIGLAPAWAAGQSKPADITGTWRADTPDGPTDVIVRSDSSASLGEETVRWRLVADSIHIAFGDEWMVYAFALQRNRLTLSGGDLEEPMELRKVGPATPLPEGVTVPPAPPAHRRATPF